MFKDQSEETHKAASKVAHYSAESTTLNPKPPKTTTRTPAVHISSTHQDGSDISTATQTSTVRDNALAMVNSVNATLNNFAQSLN